MNSTLSASRLYAPESTIVWHAATLPRTFAEPAVEYRRAREAGALFDRSDRGLLLVTGNDRKTWLHNLVTNAVKTLDDYAGNYAFACDVRGRIQFDLCILSGPDAIRIDVERQVAAKALTHFDRFLITEDARLEDASPRFARLAASGPAAETIATHWRLPAPHVMGALSSYATPIEGAIAFRHDFAGAPGIELIVPMELAAATWDTLVGDCGLTPAGQDTLNLLRVEAGIPWLGEDIDDTVVPAETGQLERAVSFKKGCYLGQEIIERMRSHGSVARKLARLGLTDASTLAPPAPIRRAGRDAGRVTSIVRRPTDGAWLGLGYLRTNLPDFEGLECGDPPQAIRALSS